MTPWTRSFFVRARVSMPSMPGMPFSRSHSSRVLAEVAWEGFWQSSETMYPAIQGFSDSKLAGLTP
jgi:hypothetical protein